MIYRELNDNTGVWDDSVENYVELWDMPNENQVYQNFEVINGKQTGRSVRQEFAYRQYCKEKDQSILDVGCGDAIMRQFHPNGYHGIDLYGKPDTKHNLNEGTLPFQDNSFNLVYCLEVLEHVDRPQRLIDELIRVSETKIVISLPNCWRQTYYAITNNDTDIPEYGFPSDIPLDRHKWFFGVNEADSFINEAVKRSDTVLTKKTRIINNGGLIRTSNISTENQFTYPPNKPYSKLTFLQKKFHRYMSVKESVLKYVLFTKEARKHVNTISSWYEIKKCR